MKLKIGNNTTREVVNIKFDLSISLETAVEVRDMKRFIQDLKEMDRITQKSKFQGYDFQCSFIRSLEGEFMEIYNNPDIVELLEDNSF